MREPWKHQHLKDMVKNEQPKFGTCCECNKPLFSGVYARTSKGPVCSSGCYHAPQPR